jgi:hypothetical protein
MAEIRSTALLPGSGSGWIYVTDAATVEGDAAVAKVFQDVAGTILQSFTSPSVNLRLSLRASYPLVEVNTVPAELTRDPIGGYYYGDVDVTVVASGDVTCRVLTSDAHEAARDTVAVTLDLPPVIQTLSFTGAYPGGQTELKENDTYAVTGTTDIVTDAIEVIDYEAGKSTIIVIAPTTNFTVAVPIADRGNTAVLRPARIRARSTTTSAYGATRDTNELGGAVEGVDLVRVNNLAPGVVIGVVVYPGAQLALKGSETATVGNNITNADVVSYTSPGAELSITNPSIAENPKTVQRIAGTFNTTVNNFRITATRNANGAVTVANAVVSIANTAASIVVTEPAARLRSGGNDGTAVQNHTITLTSDQPLLSAPTLSAAVGGGTFTGVWAGGPNVWTRTLQVHDDDTKGTYGWTGLSATNLAGVVTSAITGDAQYVLGGAVARTIAVPAFSSTATINVAFVDYAKVQAGIWSLTANQSVKAAVQGDTTPLTSGYTIQTLSVNPSTLVVLDATIIASNTGTLQLLNVEETV